MNLRPKPPLLLHHLITTTLLLLLTITPFTTSSSQSSLCPLKHPSIIKRRPLIIGHRGTSFNIPEHTLAGYRLALELGADYIEPDLVPTKDGHLVAVHSFDLNVTTDVALKFPERYRVNVTHHPNQRGVDVTRTGYVSQDFTLEEIKSLRVRQRVEDTPARSRYFDWMFEVPTIGEIIDLLAEWNFEVVPYLGRTGHERAGLYVELKYPTWLMEDTGMNVADLLLDELRSEVAFDLFFNESYCDDLKFNEYVPPPLVMECFESNTLAYLTSVFEDDYDSFGGVVPPSVLLVMEEFCFDDATWFGVGEMKRLDGIGPHKNCVLGNGGREFMNLAIVHNLAVHPWTQRMETEFVDERFENSEEELQNLFCKMGVDGIFAENVDMALGVAARGCDDDREEMKEEVIFRDCVDGMGKGGAVSLFLFSTLFGAVLGALMLHFNNYRKAKAVERRGHKVPDTDDEYPARDFTIE